MRRILLTIHTLAVGVATALGQTGTVVVVHDDQILSNFGFAADAAVFASNVFDEFANCQSGSFLVYSNSIGLIGSELREAAEGLGHTWTVDPSTPFTLENLLAFDGVFVGGSPANCQVLIDYVDAGGCVYLFGGTGLLGSWGHDPVAEAAAWSPFLANYGLAFAPSYNFIEGKPPIDAGDVLLARVGTLFQSNGQSVIDLDTEDPSSEIIVSSGSDGLIAVHRTTAPSCIRTVYVDHAASGTPDGLSWPTAFAHLQDALTFARATPSVREIWVAAGTYATDPTSLDRALSFDMVSNVAVLGGFTGTERTALERDPAANLTVLTGDLLGDDDPTSFFNGRIDNAYHVVTATGLVNASISGFTVRNGYSDNNGASSGGGLYLVGGSLSVADCIFKRNTAYFSGSSGAQGAGVFVRNATFVANDCDISDNYAESSNRPGRGTAGGMKLENSTAHLFGCRFGGNTVSGSVSELQTEGTNLTVEQCTFENGVGQATSISGGTALLLDSVWQDNLGGGVCGLFASGPVTISGCLFQRNITGGEVGALLARSGVSVENTTFRENSSAFADAIRVEGSTVSDCLFEANTGASPLHIRADGVVERCVIRANNASARCESNATLRDTMITEGGTLHVNGNARVERCTFSFGGSIWLDGGNPSLHDCLIHDNAVGVRPWRTGSNARAVNCTIVGNTVGLAGFSNGDPGLKLVNSIVYYNETNLDEIVNGHPDFQACYNCIEGGYAGIGNITPEPGFEDLAGVDEDPLNDFRIGADSPCVDAGDSTAILESATDFDGNPRCIDLPNTIGTGVPNVDGCIVDIGAYEVLNNGIVACLCETTGDNPPDLTVADLLAYLGAWFAGLPTADFTGDGTGIEDLLQFLQCWFADACFT